MSDALPSPQSAATSSRRKWVVILWSLATAAIWLKAVMNLTVRDEIPRLAIAYYAVPTFVLGLAAGLLAWIGRQLAMPRVATWSLLGLALAAAAAWILGEFRAGPVPQPSANGVRAVFWNVGRGKFGEWEDVAKQLKQFDADVLAVAEATSEEFQTVGFWRQRMPNYSVLPLHDGILLLVRGEAIVLERGSLPDEGAFRRVEVSIRGTRFDILMADIISDPLVSRKRTLEKLWRIMQRQADRPTILVGDFNTPPSSVYFDRWRETWSRAWETSGSGYQPTWPQPIPLLTLDHVWGNRWLRFQHCAGGWSNCSDHRPVVFEFTIERPRTGELPVGRPVTDS